MKYRTLEQFISSTDWYIKDFDTSELGDYFFLILSNSNSLSEESFKGKTFLECISKCLNYFNSIEHEEV